MPDTPAHKENIEQFFRRRRILHCQISDAERADDPELTAIRLKQANLIGPAGFISMEDGHATEIVQRAIADRTAAESVVVMGGYDAADRDDLVNEAAIRGFWQHYRELLGERVGHAPGGDRG